MHVAPSDAEGGGENCNDPDNNSSDSEADSAMNATISEASGCDSASTISANR
jgi:hypothetical protein